MHLTSPTKLVKFDRRTYRTRLNRSPSRIEGRPFTIIKDRIHSLNCPDTLDVLCVDGPGSRVISLANGSLPLQLQVLSLDFAHGAGN